MKNEQFRIAVNRILDARDETMVYSTLLSLAPLLGFESSRMYIVNRCPFRNVFVYSLASQWPTGTHKVQTGFKISYPTIPEDEPYAFEKASVAALDERKLAWIEELDLHGKEWIDIELRSKGERESLWCLSRPEGADNIGDSAIAQLLCLVKLASTQVDSKRTDRAVLALSSLDEQKVAHDRGLGGGLRFALTEIQQSLNAQFVAFFRWSPATDSLVKELEISADGDVMEFGSSVDAAYPIRTSLTGTAYVESGLMFIPFFDHMREIRPELADERSVEAHSKYGAGIASVMYQPLSPIASCPGMIRIINRADHPELPFQTHDAALLRQLAGTLERMLSVDAAGSLFSNLEGAVSKFLDIRVSQEDAFKACEEVLAQLGFSGFQVLMFDDSGRLSRTSWPTQTMRRTREPNESRHQLLAGFRRPGHGERIKASFSFDHRQTDRHVTSFVKAFGIGDPFAYSYFTHTNGLVFLILPVRVIAPANVNGDFWLRNPALANALLVLIELCAHGISMRANRDALRDAGTSVAVIAHEFRSPSVSLRSLANTLISDVRRVIDNSSLTIPLPVKVTPPAELSSVASKSDLLKYLSDMRSRVKSSDMRLTRAVKDGLMWARMGSNVIELEFAKIHLADVFRRAFDEIQPDLARRTTVTIETRGLKSLPPIVAVADLIQGLLVNLLDNATKYSFDGQVIEIRGSHSGSSVTIAITNFGLGIHEDDLPHIFTPFYRAKHRDPRHPIRGVGLGLPTCERIVHLHNGSITVVSKAGYSDPLRTEQMEGFFTTFTVSLPTSLSPGRRDVQAAK